MSEATQDIRAGSEGAQSLFWSRNGRRMACLPCRRRKMACDHGLPTCQRCQRAKSAVLCVYEAAAEGPRKSRKRTAPSSPDTPARDSPPSIVESPNVVLGSPSDVIKPVEFLGPTSIPTFMQELDGQLLPTLQTRKEQEQTGLMRDVTVTPLPGSPRTDLASHHTLGVAVEVLQCIPDRQTCAMLISRCRDPVDGWLRSTVHRLSDSLHDTFRLHDGKARRANLTQMAYTLARNTSRAIDERGKDMEQWLTSISGSYLHWECVGVLFSYWATASMRSDDDGQGDLPTSSMGGHDTKGEQTDPSRKYMQCVHHCINLCGRLGGGSTLLVQLLLKATYLTSIQHGDASLVADRLLGECITVAVSLGMHITTSPHTTSFLTEVRRRLFAHVFVVDKNGAILTGRPPRLGRRYCSTALPLDVSDGIVMALPGSPVPIDQVTAGLVDAHGWNTQGALYRTTLMRARNLFSRVRDDILEISLNVSQSLDVDVLGRLKERQEALYAQLPPALYLDGDPAETLDVSTTYAKRLVKLDHLQNLFFISRLLVKATSSASLENPVSSETEAHSHSRDLVRVSYDMLVVMLGFWTHGTYSPRALSTNYDWLVLGYACPAAGILCGELLHPSVHASQDPSGPRRSDIVYHLSLLSGFLTRIGPRAANASLWNTVKDLIHRVLDQLLNTTVSSAGVNVGERGDRLPATGTMHDFGVAADDFHDVFAFDLLDSFSWLHD